MTVKGEGDGECGGGGGGGGGGSGEGGGGGGDHGEMTAAVVEEDVVLGVEEDVVLGEPHRAGRKPVQGYTANAVY